MRLIVKRLQAAAGVAAIAGALAFVPVTAPKAYVATTGQALYDACGGGAPHVCLSYLAGVIDMHEVGLLGREARLFCPENAPPEKVGRGVWLYYQQHPDALEQPAAFGAVQALALMFPCD